MGKPIHILVADDDDDDQFIIKEAISEMNNDGIIVTPVYDGAQLMDYLYKKSCFSAEGLNRPDLILIDIHMPMLNGLEALAQIKADKSLSDIPVCMISTPGCEKHYAKCRELGALELFPKPNHISAYRTIMEDIFSRTFLSEVL